EICPGEGDSCELPVYEGRQVEPDQDVASAMAPFLARTEEVRNRELGVSVVALFPKSREEETALGNLLADLMREARDGDVAIMNGGGIRADLLPGALTYGAFYTVFPFDNRFAVANISGEQLYQIVGDVLEGSGSIISLSGITAVAECGDQGMSLTLLRTDGTPVAPEDEVRLIVSDFIAMGGDGLLEEVLAAGVEPEIESGRPIRDVLVDLMEDGSGDLDPAQYLDTQSPRISYPGSRPICQ
ncbi:MAG: 5'-nucleotidase C-terminal domain-containing protein, partial [Myxococcales bacterium]|nr:5'-nucleotidase C-terminal domain-containing protein [Myxococcales bacterium]